MTLALAAVLLAILLSPPLLIHFTYRSGTYARPAPQLSLLEMLLLSAFGSLILHAAVISIFQLDVDFAFIVRLASGNLDAAFIESNKTIISKYFIGFTKYIAWVSTGCAFLGLLLRYMVTRRQLRMTDWLRKFRKDTPPTPFLRYFNKWWYLFRANEYDREFGTLKHETPFVWVDVLVETKDAAIIYSGFLYDFITEGEKLDRLYLQEPTKCLFTQKETPPSPNILLKEGDEFKIDGGIFCISADKILNINVMFVEQEIEVTQNNGGTTTLNDTDAANYIAEQPA